MRIIGGKYRGKTIKPPSNFRSRPTTDFAKEALFTILYNSFNFENIDVLDLFGGTGSITYEFCSRNVNSIVCVESNHSNSSFISRQIEKLDFNQAKVVKTDVFRYLKTCKLKFDVVFADPPYSMINIEEIYHLVFNNNILTDTSFLIIEQSSKNDFSKFPHFVMQKKYGSVHFSFFDPEV